MRAAGPMVSAAARLQLGLPRDRFELEADLVAAAAMSQGFRQIDPRRSVSRKVLCSTEQFLTSFPPHGHVVVRTRLPSAIRSPRLTGALPASVTRSSGRAMLGAPARGARLYAADRTPDARSGPGRASDARIGACVFRPTSRLLMRQ